MTTTILLLNHIFNALQDKGYKKREGNVYVFHRVTHSKTSGGKKNWEINPNPIKGDKRPMNIVKKEERDEKARFSLFEIDLKDGIDVSYPDIKLTSELLKQKKNKIT